MSAGVATDGSALEETLVSSGVLTADNLALAKTQSEKLGQPLFTYLLHNNLISDEQLTKVNAAAANIPYVNLQSARIDPKILSLLPQETAERYMAVPMGEIEHRVAIAMLDPTNVQAVDFLSNKIGRPIRIYAASEASIRTVLKQYQLRLDSQLSTSLKAELDVSEAGDAAQKPKNIQTIVQDSPISKALSAILEFAARNRASDVHIEPLEKELKIRCRVDGVLREIMKLPKSNEPALVSRIKILANLKIDEHRTPQDGQFTVRVDNKDIDLRIAISPVVWGEQVVIRLLDKTGTSLKLEDLGYGGRALRMIRDGLKQSSGMVLTSGPTGSGKSTSMYALIQEIKNDTVNIVTLEDPVEYKIEGVNQIQVNPEVGLDFASGLRSILRQDPDVIMVGEIRDTETAQLAVQAALTGHLVFSTLHTNSAAGILPRLLDMGIEPFLIASTVHTVIGQRLVRRLDKPQGYQASATEVAAIQATLGSLLPASAEQVEAVSSDLGYKNLPLANQNAYTLYKGQDTSDTPGGYRGRLGLYEAFTVTDEIQALIMQHATSSQIEKAALAQGMISMREDGYLKALNGTTTLAEVNRVASEGATA